MWILADDDIDSYYKSWLDGNAYTARLTDGQIRVLDTLINTERMQLRFNANFLTRGDSREPEQAGIWGAVIGSFLTLMLTLVLSFPIGIAAAVYLEEFAPKNKVTDFIEVNINNLAAVPSIIFWSSGACHFYQSLPNSTINPCGGRFGPRGYDIAYYHYHEPGGYQVSSTLNQRGRSRYGCVAKPDGASPRLATCFAGHVDRSYYWYGAGA